MVQQMWLIRNRLISCCRNKRIRMIALTSWLLMILRTLISKIKSKLPLKTKKTTNKQFTSLTRIKTMKVHMKSAWVSRVVSEWKKLMKKWMILLKVRRWTIVRQYHKWAFKAEFLMLIKLLIQITTQRSRNLNSLFLIFKLPI